MANSMDLSLPIIVTLDASAKYDFTTLVLDRLGKDHIMECYDTFKLHANSGLGIGSNEFPNLEVFKQKVFNHGEMFGIFNKNSNEMVAMFNICPSPVCRSQKPLTNAGFAVVLKPNRRIGRLIGLLFVNLAISKGYYGFLGRSSPTNIASNKVFRNIFGGFSLGTIPYSINLKGAGWVEDFIEWFGYDVLKECESITDAAEDPANAPISTGYPLFNYVKPDSWDCDFKPVSWMLPNGGEGILQRADQEQKYLVEQHIYMAAQKGEGFGVDEFTSECMFNRKLFQKSTTVVLLTPDQNLRGFFILGPSNLCREDGPRVLQAYVVDTFNTTEVEEVLIQFVLDYAEKNGYYGVLYDVYRSQDKKISLLLKLGFFCTASLPYCGCIKGRGYMDSLLLFKHVEVKSLRMGLSAIRKNISNMSSSKL